MNGTIQTPMHDMMGTGWRVKLRRYRPSLLVLPLILFMSHILSASATAQPPSRSPTQRANLVILGGG